MSHAHNHDEHNHHHSHKDMAVIIISTLLLLVGLSLQWLQVATIPHFELLWYGLTYVLASSSIIRNAFTAMTHGDVFSEFMLMTIASIGAFLLGEYPEAVAVMLLYRIGEWLQEKAVARAHRHIKNLAQLTPDLAYVVSGDKLITRPLNQVAIDDIIEVKPGGRVPLDGTLTTPRASFDTKALTGETLPQHIGCGCEVLAGMINLETTIQMRVKRVEAESTIARMQRLVEDATQKKSKGEIFTRKFARTYTPIIVALAALTVLAPFVYSLIEPEFAFHFTTWLRRSFIFLVISCPCALVISIPLTYFGGIGAASKQGIFFKSTVFLDICNEIDCIVFDKTGTLTTGNFQVTHLKGVTEQDVQTMAAIEQHSTHPLAMAIKKYAESQSCSSKNNDSIEKNNNSNVTESRAIAGGFEAKVSQDHWLIGSPWMLEQQKIVVPDMVKTTKETIVACAKNGDFIGYVLLEDLPKNNLKTTISSLKKTGIEQMEILSGDRQSVVDKLKKNLGLKNAFGDLLPEDKVRHVEQLKQQGKKVAFVGDGMNDAPVLAASDVGIAMGKTGTDMAIEVADVVIKTDEISAIAKTLQIARKTRTIVWQNILLAIGVKMAVMILGLFDIATLWSAVFADSGVALLAVINTLRIFRTKT